MTVYRMKGPDSRMAGVGSGPAQSPSTGDLHEIAIAQLQNCIQKDPQLGTCRRCDTQIFPLQDSFCIASLRIMPRPLASPEDFLYVIRGRVIVVYGFRGARGGCPVVSGQLLDGGPIRKQPGFKIMLRHMGMEAIVRADPASHFPLRILGILKIVRACIDIRERNHVVGVRIRASEQSIDHTLQLVLFGDSAVLFNRYQPRQLASREPPRNSRR